MSSLDSNFQIPPFPSYPSVDRFVAVGSQQDALQRVARAVSAWEAISLVIGPPGTGKSLLGQMLAKQFSDSRVVVLLGDATIETPTAMQRYLLRRLQKACGIEATCAESPEDLQLALIESIEGSSDDFPGLLLLVDEAQTLSSEVLETIRILTNVMCEGRPRVSAVLLGGPKLDETLALPSLEALVQRVATRCYLHPFNNDETVHYIRQVISSCGSEPEEAIREEAIRSIHRACSGVPRLINQLMTAAIDVAASDDQACIDSQIVDRAWAVLQQLPSPLLDEPPLTPPSPVEFGPLSDEAESSDGRKSAESLLQGTEPCPVAEPPSESIEIQPTADSCPSKMVQDTAEKNHDEGVAAKVEVMSDAEIMNDAKGDETTASTDPVGSTAEWFDTHTETAAAIAFESVSIDCASSEFPEETVCEMIADVGEVTVPENKPPVSVPSPDDLFGTFDNEEEVIAGEAAFPTAGLKADDGESDRTDEGSLSDLEDSLHQEVLQLRSATANQLHPESDATTSSTLSAPPTPSAPPLLWLADEEPEPLPASQDDRDMLVVEDDIRVEGGQLVNEKQAEPAAEPLSVDFQGMLAKMRAPRGK